MKMLKSLTPNFIKQGISPLLNLYRRATVYRNRTIHLGGRLNGYFASSQKIDFIKMDIEGAEAVAIPAMKQLLVKSRPLMCIEFHDETAWQTRQILIDADYQFYDIQLQQWLSLHDTKRVYHCFIVPKEKVNQVTL